MKFLLTFSTFIAITISQETDLQELQSQLEDSLIEFVSMDPFTAVVLHTKERIEYRSYLKQLVNCRILKPGLSFIYPIQTSPGIREPMVEDYKLRDQFIENALKNMISNITWEKLDPLPHTYIVNILKGIPTDLICLDLYGIWFKSKLIFHDFGYFHGVLARFKGNVTHLNSGTSNDEYQASLLLIDLDESPELEFVTHFLKGHNYPVSYDKSIQSLVENYNWKLEDTREKTYCPTVEEEHFYWPETKFGRVAIPFYYCDGESEPRRHCLGSLQEGAYWETIKEPTQCITSKPLTPSIKLLEGNITLEEIRDILMENSADLNHNDVNIISKALKAQVGKSVNLLVLADVLDSIIEKYDYDEQIYDNTISSLMSAILDTVDMFIPHIQPLEGSKIINKYLAAVSLSKSPGFALYDKHSLILLKEDEPALQMIDLHPEIGVYFLNTWNGIFSSSKGKYPNMSINYFIMKSDFFFPTLVKRYRSHGHIVGVGMVPPHRYRFGGATMIFAFRRGETDPEDFSCAMWDPKQDKQWVISSLRCSKGVTKESVLPPKMDICLCNVLHSGIIFFTRVHEEQNPVEADMKKQSLELLYKKTTRELTLFLNVNLTRYGRPEDLIECSVRNYGLNYPIYFHSGTPVVHKYQDYKSEYLKKQLLYKVTYKGEGSMICTDKLGFGLVSNEIQIREYNVAIILFACKKDVMDEIDQFVNDYPIKYLLPFKIKVDVQQFSIIDGVIKLRFWQSLHKNHTNFMESVKVLSQKLSQDYQWEVLNQRSASYCPSIEEEGFQWPVTPCGFPAIPNNPCLDSEGVATPTRLCIGDYIEGSYWEPPQKIPEECRRPTERSRFLLNTSDKKDKIAAVKEASKIVEYSQSLNPYEISMLAKILKEAANEVSYSHSSPPNVTSLAIIMDSILSEGKQTLRIANASTGSSQFLRESLEVLLAAAASPAPIVVSKPHFSALTATLSSGVQGFSYDSSKNKMIPLFGNETTRDLSLRTSALLRNSDLNDGIVTSVVFQDDSLFESSNEDTQIHGHVLGVSLFSEDENKFWEYDLPLELLLLFPRGEAYDRNFICQFWNPIENHWSDIGCRIIEDTSFSEEFVACICTHTTYFTLLISQKSIKDIYKDNLAGYHTNTTNKLLNSTETDFDEGENYSISDIERYERILYVLSIVGCSISLLCLVIILILACAFQQFRNGGRKKIHINISLSNVIFMGSYLVIASYGRTPATEEIKYCIELGVLLHYSLLTTFCWSFMSALLLIFKFKLKDVSSVNHRRIGTRYVLRAGLFSWIFPAVIVVLVLFTGKQQYKRRDYSALCFPEGEAFKISVVVPISLIYVVNIIVFFIIVQFIFCKKEQTNTDEYQGHPSKQFYYTLLYFIFLGISWIFGIVINFIPSPTVQLTLLLSYCFCVMATLQGISMLFLFVISEHFINNTVYKPQAVSFNAQREEVTYLSVRTDEPGFNKHKKDH